MGGRNLADMCLAGSDPLLEMRSMIFHIGTDSASTLQGHAMLTTGNKRKLDNFFGKNWVLRLSRAASRAARPQVSAKCDLGPAPKSFHDVCRGNGVPYETVVG
jgi:hypothetical protein